MSSTITNEPATAAAADTGVTVTLTPAALAKVREISEAETLAGRPLRIYVEGGGCSGLQYGFAFDDPRPDDVVCEVEGFNVVLDPLSAPYLAGCVVDYVDALTGAGFKIENPNAKTSCGCGQSFA